MRNLEIFRRFTSGSPLPLPGSSVICLGEPGYLLDAIGLTVSEGDPNPSYFLSNLIRISEFAHIEELVKSNLLQDVIQMQYMVERGDLYLATRRGGFLHYPLAGEVEELFQSETGLSTFAVSPDSRLVVTITKAGTMLLLSLPDLELVTEEVLFEIRSGEEGEGDYSVQVCWRNDSRYFGLNVPNGINGARTLRFYDEHGMIFSKTEDTLNLTSDIISWQPSGGLIVSLEKQPAGKIGTLVSFFELNGLKRSEFNPDEANNGATSDEPILNISWNSSSEILALRRSGCIELWHRSNYLWMLKGLVSRRESNGHVDNIKFYSWDRELAYKLHVVFESGYYSFYEFNLNYSSGFSGGSCLTVSINGNSLYSTPFRDNCGPPPYGFYQVSVESKVKEVVISSFWDGFICILWSGKVVLVKNNNDELKVSRTLIGDERKLLNTYNWVWPNSTTLCCICDNRILSFLLPDPSVETADETRLTFISAIPMNCSSLISVQKDGKQSNTLLVRKHGGSILLLDLNATDVVPRVISKAPADYLHNLAYLYSGKSDDIKDMAENLILIGHDQVTRKLEVFSSTREKFKLASDCISMATFDDYLLYTTVQGSLEIVHVSQLVLSLNALSGASNGHGVRKEIEKYSRKIEKGAVILSCCWNKMLEPALVLQILPRGNIETIFPRPLIISSIKIILRDEKKRCFKTIMTAMRRHRIDANVLLDELKLVNKEAIHGLNMRQAFNSMVEQVTDPNILVLFVTEINSENIESVNLMKSVLEDYTNTENGSNGILPYLATMAKLGLYEEILHSKLIFGESDREIVKKRVKFLSFYADNSEILYEAALGTYDLNLTSIVADCLNKDPKEFLPILNELKDLPLEKRCFSIDNTLKRWTKGVRSLIRDSSIPCNEIIKYIERHRLYSETLGILADELKNCGRDDEELNSIHRAVEHAYGFHLESHGKLREASIFYRRAGSFSKAIECCTKNGSWELALTIAFEENQNAVSLQNLCNTLLVVLEDREEFESAARLCEVYKEDYRLAVQFWTLAKKWKEAHTLSVKEPDLSGLVLELIKPKLIESQIALEEFVASTRKDVTQYTSRLEVIKEIKKNKELLGDVDGDTFSDTESVASTASFRSTSASSTLTGKTCRSSKNRRKLERKLYSLKEGSQFEDIAITVHLWETFTRLHNEVKKDVSYTVECLWIFGLDNKALALTAAFDQLIKEVDISVIQIWSSPLPENPVLELKYRMAPIGWTTIWDKLSLTLATTSSPSYIVS